jgi:hypothetical protein
LVFGGDDRLARLILSHEDEDKDEIFLSVATLSRGDAVLA